MNTKALLTMTIIAFVIIIVIAEMVLSQLANKGGLFGDKWYHKVGGVLSVILLIIIGLSLANAMLDLFNQS